MNILITGGAGFIGQRLTSELLSRGYLNIDNVTELEIDSITLADIAEPQNHFMRPEVRPRVQFKTGDLTDNRYVRSLFEQRIDLIFHLASIVSGHGEADFDLALHVNLFASEQLFNQIRAQGNHARTVFASSIAVFGGDAMPATVGDFTKQTPGTTYGMTKSVVELLVNDFSRKQFFDGRSGRLPTVIIRPGSPNRAASSFFSGLFREPLTGRACVIPVEPNCAHPVSGYRDVVANLIKLAEIDSEKLGSDRAVCLPAINTTVMDLINALKNTAPYGNLGEHLFQPDPMLSRIIDSWPKQVDASRALALGFEIETCIEKIVNDYIQDYMPAR